MLDYTFAAFGKIVEDFKKLGFGFTVGTNLAYIVYLIYALATSRGELWVNIPLLVFSTAYLGFYLFATKFGTELDGKKNLKRTAKKVFKWAKKLMSVYTLGATLYTLTGVSQGADIFYVLLTAMQVMLFLLQIAVDIIIIVVNKYADMVKTAVTMDVQQVTKPLKTASNFFKKMTGREVEEEETEPTKTQEMLTARVQTAKEKKAKEKEAKRLEKELRKKQRKEEKNPAKEIESTVEILEETAFSEPIEETPTPAKEKKKKGFFRKK